MAHTNGVDTFGYFSWALYLDEHKTLASRIVTAVMHDLTGRRGLRHEWDAIDRTTQREILDEWMRLAKEQYTQDGVR